jgi:hypothetical protein
MVRLKQGVMAALLAALMSLFALTTAVEAATCAMEPAIPSAAEASAGLSDTQPGDPNEGRAICSHCLCHHGGAPLPQMPEPMVVAGVMTTVPVVPASEALDSRTPSGLKRPPRP